MAKIWPAINGLLASKSAITSELGSPLRLNPNRIKQGVKTFPSGYYRTVSIQGNPNFQGASKHDFNMVDLYLYANTLSECEALAKIIRENIEDETGTYNGIELTAVRFMGESTDWADELEKHTIQMEFFVSSRR